MHLEGQVMQEGILTEADTCREFVTPKLIQSGWGAAPYAIGEQRSFTNGRIIVAGGKVRRGQQKRADYLLYYRRDYPLAVVEAKEAGLPAENGVQQAREYAEILGLKFAYATNGHRIIEIDYITGTEREVERSATPDELFARLTAAAHLPQAATPHLLEPFNLVSGKAPRYYQQIAIQRVIEAILLGQTRILATLLPAPAKPAWRFKSAGSCGTAAGTVPANTVARKSCSSLTAIFWSMTRWPRCSRPLATPGTRSAVATPARAGICISASIKP
jgi:type I restriction enzyme R subunit